MSYHEDLYTAVVPHCAVSSYHVARCQGNKQNDSSGNLGYSRLYGVSVLQPGEWKSQVNLVLNVHRNRLGRRGERGYGGGGGRGRLYTYRYIHCHHQNDFSVKMGSDESHFNVSFIVRDKVTRQCPQTTAFEEPESRAEAESNRGPSAWTAYNLTSYR